MKRNKVLIWTKSISDLFDGKVSGIAVQLYFWAQTFKRHSWQVTSFTNHRSFSQEGIIFKHASRWGKLEIMHEWLSVFGNLLFQRPQIIVFRGCDRVVFPIAIISKLLDIKFVFFGASDSNFDPGKEQIVGGKHNRKLWQKSVQELDYIIVQNQHQLDTLKKNYGKQGTILFNIWGNTTLEASNAQPTDVVWVANYRPLKRPEWIIEAAKEMSDVDFTMVGGPVGNDGYYKSIEHAAAVIPNLHFLGAKSFAETNVIVSKSRLLCCTSTFEGFPNTFLQAWANNIPVVSTVDPSNVISKYDLGFVVGTEEELQIRIRELLQDIICYNKLKLNIQNYFTANHDPDTNFKKMLDYINVDK